MIQDRGPGTNEAEKLLPTIVSDFAQIFIVVDGLDELREPKAFLRVLPLLLRETTCTLKVIVFCRDYIPDHLLIQSKLRDYPQLHVDQGANKDDIAIFISSKFSRDDPDWDPGLLDVVKTVLLDRADGMFLYVSLMAGRLRGSLSRYEVMDRLITLPQGLTRAYEANLKRILNQEDEGDKILTLRILLWIANANRSLSRKELLEALSIRQGTKEKDTGGTDREFTTFCAELVYFDHDDFYHLVHTSLRDYLFEVRNSGSAELEDYRVMQLHAERTLAEACLTYLLFGNFSAGPVRSADDLAQLLQENPFLRYAAENWGSHVALSAEDAPTGLVWEFIDNENARNLCMQVITAQDNVYPFPGSSSPLHILAYFGLSTFANERSGLRALKHQIDGFGLLPLDYAMIKGARLMCLWLLEKEETAATDDKPVMARYSAYHVAVTLEWDDVLERLVADGYDLEFLSSNKRRTPLAEAAAQGNRWALNRLLEAKADVNAKDADGKNPLMIALEEDHQNLVLPLLENGADLDAQDDEGVSALHFAVDSGNLDAVKTLLVRKPRLQMTGETFWNQTPLHLAAEHDHDEIFKELHNYGAELECTCMGGFRPMHLAAFHNSLKVARLLANLKAEINPQSKEEKTVLHVAAEYSGVEFVDFILTRDPEVNAKEKEFQNTALHAAAMAGATAVCKLLLDKGAGVDLPNATKHTALHLAVSEGHTETAKLLLDHKFSPMRTAVFDSPVLHYAANEGNKEFIQPLIEAQADPEAPNSHGHRALHFAARKGHKDFVEQLFTAVTHLDANAQDLDGKTALHLAAAAGHLSTIQLLQERGAQPDILDSSRNLPLHFAAWDGHVQVVEMLLSDSNIDTQGYLGRTILCISALRGHETLVRLLLDRNAKLELEDDDQSTPLMNAVRMNHNEIAQLLIAKDANVHTMDGECRTLLHGVARNGNIDLVKLLLDRHCDVHAVSKFGDTPFLEAVYSNNLEVTDLFFHHGVDGIHDQNNLGTTSVHAAAEEGNLQMLTKLLNAGARPDSIDRIGRSALYMAATEGRHALIEPLLSLGLEVDGLDTCYWTPLGSACEGGYIRFAEILLQHDANIHACARHTKMTALHHAAAMHKPQIIRKLVDRGANIFSRDCYGNSALDYAQTHPASLQAIKHDEIQYVALNLVDHRAILWRNIRNELKSLLLLGKPFTVEIELVRLLKLAVLANSFLYLRNKEKYQTIMYLHMELSFRPDSANLQLNFNCTICDTSINRLDSWICSECHNLYMCEKCHENYMKGWKAPKSAPEGVKMLEQLEKQIEPLRRAMLPIIERIKVQFVLVIFSLFTAVQTWADTKRKEYEAWESKFNEDGLYKSRKRPCQQLLKLLEEGRVCVKSIEEKGLEFDEQREDCGALAKKFADYHRIHNVFMEDDGFHCCDHEYLQVSRKEYDQTCLDRRVFQPDRRLADEWFRELLDKCPPIDASSEIRAEPHQSLRANISDPTTELQDLTDESVLNVNMNDRVDAAAAAPARLQERTGDKALPKDEGISDKDHAAPNKTIEAPTNSRPKMPQGLRSSFTLNFVPKLASTAEKTPIVDEKTVTEELRSPNVTATAFSNLRNADAVDSMGRISNTEKFTAELLEKHHQLKRRVTSPKFDTGDPFEDSTLKRRATTPFPTVPEFQEWTISHRLKEAQQPIPSEAPASDGSTSLYGTPSLTQEPNTLGPSGETLAEPSTDREQKVTVSISNTSENGRLVILALTVAESIFPGFGDEFVAARLERGDLADYWLQLEVDGAAEGE